MTKQEKMNRKGAKESLTALNNFLSELSDISNETGYQIPGLYQSTLTSLHAELMKKMIGG